MPWETGLYFNRHESKFIRPIIIINASANFGDAVFILLRMLIFLFSIRNWLPFYAIAVTADVGLRFKNTTYFIRILNLSMFFSFQYSQKCKSKSLLLVFEFILHLSLTHNCLLTSISAIIIHENLETTTQNVSKQQRIYLYCLKILRHVYWDMHIETFILRWIINTCADRIII